MLANPAPRAWAALIWALAMSHVLAFNVKEVPETEFNLGKLSFTERNIQVPFFNNILGNALAWRNDKLVITSGLYQTAFECDTTECLTGTNCNPVNMEVYSTNVVNGCQNVFSEKDDRNIDSKMAYKGIYALGSNVFENAVDKNKNNFKSAKLPATYASWAWFDKEKNQKIGYGFGSSVAIADDGSIAVGCPGCYGLTTDVGETNQKTVAEKSIPAAGLVFTVKKSNGALEVKDASYFGTTEASKSNYFFGGTAGDLKSNLNYEENCYLDESACNFGASVMFYEGDRERLFASRMRSSRVLGRPKVESTNECLLNAEPANNDVFCIDPKSEYPVVGDVLDLQDAKLGFTGNTHSLSGSKVLTIADYGFKNNGSNNRARFKPIDTFNPGAPSNARMGETMTWGKLLDGSKKGVAVGAPNMSFKGRVFLYNVNESYLDTSVTGLRYDSKEPFITITPGTKVSLKANFGQTLHAFKLNKDGSRDFLAIGAPMDTGCSSSGGSVFVYKGSTLKAWLCPAANTISRDARFGKAITATDLDGDGYPEVIVGAPFNKVGCGEGKGYCGALYIFSGNEIFKNSDKDKAVNPTQVIYGKDFYSMLGFALTSGNSHVYASAPGGYGNGKFFDSNLLKAYDAGTGQWDVTSTVFKYGTASVATVQSAYRETVPAAKPSGDSLFILDISQFDKAGDQIEFVYRVERLDSGSENINLEYQWLLPAQFDDDVFFEKSSTAEYVGDATLLTGNTFELANDQKIDLKMTVKRKDQEVLEGLQSGFTVDLAIKASGALAKTSPNSKLSDPKVFVLANIVDSDFTAELDVPDDTYLIGEKIPATLTVTNNLGIDDSFLSVTAEFFGIFSSALGYNANIFTSRSTVEADDPQSIITGRLGPIGAGKTKTFDITFSYDSPTIFKGQPKVDVTVFGIGGTPQSFTKKFQIDQDTCTPKIKSTVTAVTEKILQGEEFNLIVDISSSPDGGAPFSPSFRVNVPKYTEVVEANDKLPVGCTTVLGNSTYIECKERDAMVTTKSNVVFTFVFKSTDDIFTTEGTSQKVEVTSREVTFSTELLNTCGEGLSQVVATIRPRKVETQNKKNGVPWWAILLSALGAVLLGGIVAGVLWKLGFFKRKKPPTDDADNGELDQEVAGGSVLRG